MAENKTEEPTPRRRRKARSEGDVPVSSALIQSASMLLVLAMLPGLASSAMNELRRMISLAIEGGTLSPYEALLSGLSLTVPVLALAATGALAAGVTQTGGLVAFAKLSPKLDSLNPIEGLKRLFELSRLLQILRALVLLTVVFMGGTLLLRAQAPGLVATTGSSLAALALGAELAQRLLWLSCGASIALAFLDLAVTRYSWTRRHRMSIGEVKREHKESEGDPQIKRQRREAHEEALMSAELGSLRNASVLIVNPTHLATALRYREEGEEAPRVVAQGQDEVAKQMIKAARAYGVPVVRDIPVARAMQELGVGDEIPETLYEAVAEILREVWRQQEEAEAAPKSTIGPEL